MKRRGVWLTTLATGFCEAPVAELINTPKLTLRSNCYVFSLGPMPNKVYILAGAVGLLLAYSLWCPFAHDHQHLKRRDLIIDSRERFLRRDEESGLAIL